MGLPRSRTVGGAQREAAREIGGLQVERSSYVFTSESVTEGHPDKVCDTIADAILDAFLEQDPVTRINCEVLCKANQVVLAGEISSRAEVDVEAVARRTIREIGYTDPSNPFCADTVQVHRFFTAQADEIDLGVSKGRNGRGEQGAGDQGMMFGYAVRETEGLMPLPIALSHRLAKRLTDDRKSGRQPWIKPDGKTQVSVRYEGDLPAQVNAVLVSVNHASEIEHRQIEQYVRGELIPSVLGKWAHAGIEVLTNPTGCFVQGGPNVDTGLTGRKIVVDTYGGAAPHGGGSFSGKDPSKVDRSGAYFARFAARQVVEAGLASRVLIQVAYAIGRADPVSICVDTYGTGDARAATDFVCKLDFRPAAIIERLGLLAPIYRATTNYGHFGKPELPWETSRGAR